MLAYLIEMKFGMSNYSYVIYAAKFELKVLKNHLLIFGKQSEEFYLVGLRKLLSGIQMRSWKFPIGLS